MRPAALCWLALLAAATGAAAADGPATATATTAPTPAAATPAPAPPATTPFAGYPLASLLFPHAAGGHQMMRAMDGGRGDMGQAVPWLASLARAFPSSMRAADLQPAQSREAVSAIEEFTGPLVRFATGGQPVAADVEQLIDSIPHLARSANALKEADKVNLSSLDITSLPSNVVSHVLNGGEIPGIDRAELDRVVREHLKRMSETADRVMRGEKVDGVEKILLPLEKVPMEMVMNSLQGKTLPGLTAAETAKIREYYTKQLPSHAPSDSADSASPLPESLSALGGMVQLLPPGYDVGRIPPEFIQSIMAGRVPDLAILPPDLQAYLGAGKDQAMMLIKSLNSSVNDIVQRLATSVKEMPEVARAAPYDISQVTHEVIDVEAHKEKQNRNVLYTIAWVALAFGVATAVVLWLLYKKFASPSRKVPASAATPPARDARNRVSFVIDSPDADVASPARKRRHVASSPDDQAKLEFVSKPCRFSTPKHPLVLDTPKVEKEEEQKVVSVEKPSDVIDQKPSDVTDDSNIIYDTTQ